MSIASMAAVTNRVSEIQSRFERNTRTSVSFAETLQAAQQTATQQTSAPPSDAGYVVAPQGIAATRHTSYGLPVGIMGTSVILNSGSTISAGWAPGAPTGDWAAQLPPAGRAWAPQIEQAAAQAGIDPRLLAAMVWQESRFQADAVSKSGAVGLTQLMPGTAAELNVDPLNPLQNLNGGARYLAWTVKEFGSVALGLAAYNAGPNRVRDANGIPNIPETQAYVPRVLDYYRQLGGVA